MNTQRGAQTEWPDAIPDVLVGFDTEKPKGWERISVVPKGGYVTDDVFCDVCGPLLLEHLTITATNTIANLKAFRFGGGSKERADTTQNEARSNPEVDSQGGSLAARPTDAVLESAPAAEVFTDEQIKIAIHQWLQYGENSVVLNRELDEPGHRGYFSGGGWAARALRFHFEHFNAVDAKDLRSELRVAGMELHVNHSNVGPVERLKEWSTCQYTYCKRRFDLAYPQGVPDVGAGAHPSESNHHNGRRLHHER
jgi:hypothetical protein